MSGRPFSVYGVGEAEPNPNLEDAINRFRTPVWFVNGSGEDAVAYGYGVTPEEAVADAQATVALLEEESMKTAGLSEFWYCPHCGMDNPFGGYVLFNPQTDEKDGDICNHCGAAVFGFDIVEEEDGIVEASRRAQAEGFLPPGEDDEKAKQDALSDFEGLKGAPEYENSYREPTASFIYDGYDIGVFVGHTASRIVISDFASGRTAEAVAPTTSVEAAREFAHDFIKEQGHRLAQNNTCVECGQPIEPLTEFPSPDGRGLSCQTCYEKRMEGLSPTGVILDGMSSEEVLKAIRAGKTAQAQVSDVTDYIQAGAFVRGHVSQDEMFGASNGVVSYGIGDYEGTVTSRTGDIIEVALSDGRTLKTDISTVGTVSKTAQVKCNWCGGNGIVDGDMNKPCKQCGGTGIIEFGVPIQEPSGMFTVISPDKGQVQFGTGVDAQAYADYVNVQRSGGRTAQSADTIVSAIQGNLGWSVAEQLQTLFDIYGEASAYSEDNMVGFVEAWNSGQLNTNALRLIAQDVRASDYGTNPTLYVIVDDIEWFLNASADERAEWGVMTADEQGNVVMASVKTASNKEYLEGWDACEAGEDISTNSYPNGSPEFFAWKKGWEDSSQGKSPDVVEASVKTANDLKDYHPSQVVDDTYYRLEFDYKGKGQGNGYSFDADASGKVIIDNPAAQKNYDHCLAHPEEFDNPGGTLRKFPGSYREPAWGKCPHDGTEVFLTDGLENFCGNGHCFNMSGTEVMSRGEWEAAGGSELAGESWDEEDY